MRPISTARLLNAAAPADLSDAAADDAAVVRLDSSSMAVTALVILLVLFFLGFFSVYARRLFSAGSLHRLDSSSYYSSDTGRSRRSSSTPQQPPRRLRGSMFAPVCGLDPAALRALPVLRYVGSGGGVGGAKDQGGCVVCLGEFEEKERVKVIPRCGHVFHPACIDAWLASRGSCPICRCTDMFRSDSSSEANAGTAATAAAVVISISLDLHEELTEGGEQQRREEEEVAVEGCGPCGRRWYEQKEEGAEAALGTSAAERRSRSYRWSRDEEGCGGVEDSSGVCLRRTCSF